jgi:hypothetical protein
MKKSLCLLMICLFSAMTYAQSSPNTTSVAHSKKEQAKQSKKFQQKKYASTVNGKGSKKQAKTKGKGL